jgi:hypothetical protein
LGYQWLTNGVALGGATNSLLSLPGVQFGQAGIYTVVVTNVYGAVTSAPAVLTVKLGQTIDFGSLIDRSFGTPPFTVDVTASSHLPVLLSVNGPASLSGNTLSLLGAGRVTLHATQAGDATYAAAPPVEQSFSVSRGNQSITFYPLEDRQLGTQPLELNAIASSGLPVRFTLVSGPATLAGSTLTVTNTGTVKIWALQPGDANYNSAPAVEVSFKVFASPPVYEVHFASDAVSFGEGAGVAEVRVQKTGGAAAVATVVVESSSAQAGRDFAQLAATPINLPEGAQDYTFKVPLIDDYFDEGPETFQIRLSKVEGVRLGSPSAVTVTIVDNDTGVATGSLRSSQVPDVATGSLRVDLARTDGRWRLGWERVWHRGGEMVSGLPPGNYPVVFLPLADAVEPTSLNVQIEPDITTSTNFTYVATPSRTGPLTVRLRANTVPDVPLVLTGSGWLLDGVGEPFGDDRTLPLVPAGLHLVKFRDVTGWTTPEANEVRVVPGQTAISTGYYLPPAGDCPPPGTQVPLTPGQLSSAVNPPLRVVGQLRSDAGFGSGVAVRPRVVLTAAHNIFDDTQLAPVPGVAWVAGRTRDVDEPPPLHPRGWYLPTGYAAQRTNDLRAGLAPGTVTDASAQLDAAALWFVEPVARGGYAGYLTSLQTPSEWLTAPRNKLLAGYPVSPANCSLLPGQMHKSQPDNYFFENVGGGVYLGTGFRGFPGQSGGPIFAQDADLNFYPAAIYLGDGVRDGVAIVSRVRVIDTNVVALINLAASSANAGTNFSGGGVIRFISALNDGDTSLQRLTVNLQPANALWQVPDLDPQINYTNGQSIFLNAPTNLLVTFSKIPDYLQPTAFEVVLYPGQDTILDFAYELVPLALTASLADGIRATGKPGSKVQLQFRLALGTGSWADEPGRTNTLSDSPTTLLTPAEVKVKSGFYRIVTIP